ncbi:hypothetical protein CRG98_033400 [Punica granatum]|uniref:CCHC-type domain-containing protein n=1 Tax=Punica granatum TaxID=22663 RepID=A0A2I0IRY0_PUNGR|nr:hypothetical protein CRG98_033400 [Punica granatum]
MPPKRRDRVDDVLERDNLRHLEQRMEQIVNQRMDLRNEVHETEDQLVARYIGGLRLQIQDTVNMFDPPNVSAVHQRALQVEKQSQRNSYFRNSSRIGCSSGASRPGGSGGGSIGVNRLGGGTNRNIANTNQPNKPTGSGMKCFGCGEIGHRQSECRKTAGKKTFFVDTEEGEDEDVEKGEYPEFDSEEVVDEEVVTRDTGTALVVRCSCLTPKVADDNWLRYNIFQSTCTVLSKRDKETNTCGWRNEALVIDEVRRRGGQITVSLCANRKRSGFLTVQFDLIIAFGVFLLGTQTGES